MTARKAEKTLREHRFNGVAEQCKEKKSRLSSIYTEEDFFEYFRIAGKMKKAQQRISVIELFKGRILSALAHYGSAISIGTLGTITNALNHKDEFLTAVCTLIDEDKVVPEEAWPINSRTKISLPEKEEKR